MNDLQDVVNEFLVESYENLDQLDRDLVTLEQDPKSEPTLSSIFRTIHTIKGTCGFLGFGKLEGVAHVGRTVSCRTGFWVEKRRVTFAWTRDGKAIRGAGRHDYRIVPADKGHALACVATAAGGAADLVVPGKPRRVR